MAEASMITPKEKDVTEEKKFVAEHLSKNIKKGEPWFLLDARWYKQWKKFVGYDSWETIHAGEESANPGPMDNSSLFKDQDTLVIRENMVEELDYVLVAEPVWEYFVKQYTLNNDAHAIKRFVIEQGMFVKHCKIEVYLPDVKMCLYGKPTEVKIEALSRVITIGAIEKRMREIFDIAADKEVRLWDKNVTSGSFEQLSKPEATMQDHSFGSPQHCLVIEPKNEDGTWPKPATKSTYQTTNSYSLRYSTNGYSESSKPGLCGLSNLGNTCFMNSALQCMSNVPELTRFFTDRDWEAELNPSNPLGMKGKIAQAYAGLVKDMWSGHHSYAVPREFKYAVSQFAPQFSGFQQHDSQELMAFLLDGLHEDLNRIKKKPYIEQKEADGRKDHEAAEEAWRDYKKRNDSVVTDLFHGQLKSTLECPEPDCGKVSVTFDPFCFLSVPMPVKKERDIEVFFIAGDPMAKPVQYKVRVPKQGIISDLCKALADKVGTASPDKLAVVDVYQSRFHKVYQHSEYITNILDRDDIFVYEIPECEPESEERLLVPVYQRKLKHPYRTWELTGQPFLVNVPAGCTLTHLYRAALQRLKRIVREPEAGERWWEADDVTQQASTSGTSGRGDSGGAAQNGDVNMSDESDEEEEEQQKEETKKLFEFEVVNSYGTAEIQKLKDDGKPLKINKRSYLAINWNETALRKFYDSSEAEQYVADDSMKRRADKAHQVNIHDCIELFTKCEQLGEKDPWYCPKCKTHRQAFKKFDLWQLPRYLVIHVKRFSYSRYYRDKLDTVVKFPVTGLDLNDFVIKNEGRSVPEYDLCAVSNHYGGMGGGHYTAYGKNKATDKWYHFDDSSVSEAKEDQVITKAAYVLLYERREAADKTGGKGAAANGSGATANGSGAAANGSGATANGSGAAANGSGASANGSGATANGSGATANGSGAATNGGASSDGGSDGSGAGGMDVDQD